MSFSGLNRSAVAANTSGVTFVLRTSVAIALSISEMISDGTALITRPTWTYNTITSAALLQTRSLLTQTLIAQAAFQVQAVGLDLDQKSSIAALSGYNRTLASKLQGFKAAGLNVICTGVAVIDLTPTQSPVAQPSPVGRAPKGASSSNNNALAALLLLFVGLIVLGYLGYTYVVARRLGEAPHWQKHTDAAWAWCVRTRQWTRLWCIGAWHRCAGLEEEEESGAVLRRESYGYVATSELGDAADSMDSTKDE